MASDRAGKQDTPMFRQYRAAKAKFPDAIVLFRMGDFYEMFFDDAVLAAPLLGIALTSRSKAAEEQIPMCGVPHHAVDSYITHLVEAGHKVAICEQMADPATVKGLVPREVIRVVTPGTNLDPEAIDARAAQYLVALVPSAEPAAPWGLAAADLTTGELLGCALDGPAAVHAELARLELSDEEKAEFARQLSEIIGYVKKIDELDTDSAEIEDAVPGRGNALREDAPRESLPREDVEKMAPEFGDGHVVVPRILG